MLREQLLEYKIYKERRKNKKGTIEKLLLKVFSQE